MGFWEFNWHLLWLGVAKAWFILGIISGIVFIVSIIPQFKRSKWGSYMKHWLFQVGPLAIFVIMLIVGLLTSPYKIYKEQENQLASIQNNLQGQIVDLRGNITSVQNQLVECLNQHRPIMKPGVNLTASTFVDQQAQQVMAITSLNFINSGDLGAYRLRIRIAYAPAEEPQALHAMPDMVIPNPTYPGTQYTTSPIQISEPLVYGNVTVGNVTMPVTNQVLLIYCALRYYDAASGGHCYDDSVYWFAYPLGESNLAAAHEDEVQVLEPFIQAVYGNQTQCQEAQ
jgi:hypothetical protein